MRLLITGSSGFLGKAIINRLKNDPLVERLCIMSRDEHKLYKLAEEYDGTASIRTFIADVRDRERMRTACQGVDAVIHAAALKRIDAVVNESIELDKTNVRGTVNVLQAAMEAGVRKALVVSSDKAVQPTNAYGTTKMMAECHAVGFNAYSFPKGLAVSVVRYGNVAKSTGSIYHIWKPLAEQGKKLPLTNIEMTRFHISMEQAVEFCISSLQRMQGGEIFVPDLPAYRLCDVGKAMLENAGRTNEKLPFQLVGLRPGGEKLAERMLSDEEPGRTLWQGDRYVVTPCHRTWSAAPYRGEKLEGNPHLVSSWPDRWMSVEALRKEFA